MKVYNNVWHLNQNIAEFNANNINSDMQLKTGDIIQAEIVDVSLSQDADNYVLLNLKNGVKIKAALEEGVTISKGEILNFVVKDVSEENITLKILTPENYTSTIQKSNTDVIFKNIAKELFDFKGIAGEIILDIASEMKQQGFDFSKTSLINTAHILSQVPDLSTENAVFLTGNGMYADNSPINFKDAIVSKDINDFLNRQINLPKKISNISQMINSVINEIQQLSSEYLQQSEISEMSLLSNAQHNINIEQSIINNKIDIRLINKNIDNNVNNNINYSNFANTNLDNKDLFISNENNMISAYKFAIEDILSKPETVTQQLKDIKTILDNSFIDIKNIAKFIQSSNDLYMDDKDKVQIFSQSDVKHINNNFKQIEFERTNKDINKNYSMLDGIKDISQEIGKQIIKNLLNLRDNIDTLMNVLSVVNTPASQQLQQNINELQRSINLLFEFNKFINFYEIPVKIGDFNANTQVYILNRRKAKPSYKNEGYTAFISLDTMNLGRFDSIINIKNKTVNVNISLQGKGQVDFIKQNIGILIQSIESLGLRAGDIRVKYSNVQKSLPQIHKEIIKNYVYPMSMLDLKI